MIDDISYAEPIWTSDHLTMEWLYDCYVQKYHTQVKKFWYNRADYEYIRTSFAAMDWDHILSGNQWKTSGLFSVAF